MGCTQSQEDGGNIVSDEESSTHSQTEKRIRRISENIVSSDSRTPSSRSERNSKKKKKKLSDLFSRFSGLGSVSTEEVTEKEVESWSDPTTGFESLMSSPAAREIFRKYLTGEFSAENLIFWTACNDLKSIKKREMFKEKVEKIFQNHLDISSQHEVSLDAKVKEKLMKERDNPGENIFSEAQSKIYSLMHRDSFARFLVSDYYMNLKREKSRGKKDVIVADLETTETSFEVDSLDILGDQSEIMITETTETTTAQPFVEMAAAGAECLLRPVSEQKQKVLDDLQTKTLDYETEKLIIFSK